MAPAEPSRAAIRPAAAADAGPLATVFIDAWRQAYSGVVSGEVLAGLDHEQVTRWLAGLIASRAEGQTEVAVSGPDVAGFVRYGADLGQRGRGHVFGLYVHPARAGQGTGRALLGHAEARLAAGGCADVSLYVFEANERARRMYSAAGYRCDGERRVEAEYGAPEVRMVKVLAG
ncbi:MAG TPA: GNAT family N-acetyltransferase [Streptosporangiaceae bacterium]|jgi:ribosomal protein S18 acetylase RimI-like enzyme|nr:GNAT family N-acetyltransferase [Streptosporangiaceae bacterium]